MRKDHSPMSLSEKFLAACISILVGALALTWAVHLLEDIWLQLLIGLAVALLAVLGVIVYRWRQNRW